MDQIISHPLSDSEILEYLPDAKIYTYDELADFTSLSQLLPSEKCYIILLYPVQSTYSGHWVAILRNKNKIEHFDSYHIYPDNELKFADKPLSQFHIEFPYLSNLYNKSPFKIIYNKMKFQKSSADIATCGRHVVFRIIHFLYNNMDICKYCKYMLKLKAKLKIDYDEIVAYYINI